MFEIRGVSPADQESNQNEGRFYKRYGALKTGISGGATDNGKVDLTAPKLGTNYSAIKYYV